MISQFCNWLDATPLSQTFQSLVWFVPSIQTVHILSIGVVMMGPGQNRPGEMLREADAALQVAKRRGPGRFELTAFAG